MSKMAIHVSYSHYIWVVLSAAGFADMDNILIIK